LRTAEIEFNNLATTGTTLDRLTSTNDATPGDGPPDNLAYQQIIAAFKGSDSPTMRAKDTEGVRAKLKRLVKRHILNESGPGQFALIKPDETVEPAVTSTPNSTQKSETSLKRTYSPLSCDARPIYKVRPSTSRNR
jgi:hypothetical protein